MYNRLHEVGGEKVSKFKQPRESDLHFEDCTAADSDDSKCLTAFSMWRYSAARHSSGWSLNDQHANLPAWVATCQSAAVNV